MTRIAIPLALTLFACGSPQDALTPEAPPPAPEPSTGLMARVSGALCDVPDVYSWVVDLETEHLTARTLGGELHEVQLPAQALPCALDATHDLELDALVALAGPCAQELGSVGGSPLLAPARVSGTVDRPGLLLVEVPEAEPRSLPRGRDVGIVLATGACGAVPMD